MHAPTGKLEELTNLIKHAAQSVKQTNWEPVLLRRMRKCNREGNLSMNVSE